jgi:hypothetical protein
MNNCIYFQALEERIGYSARAEGYPIFTQGDTFEELKENIKEAVQCYFEGETFTPATFDIQLITKVAVNG